MARQRYTITEFDLSAAEKYLDRKLHEETLFDDDDQYLKAKRAFSKARSDEIKLNRWCENWLNTDQWIKLKASLRAARKRLNDYIDDKGPPVTITLSREAWQMLSALSKRNQLTLSEFIIKRHEKAWLKLGNA